MLSSTRRSPSGDAVHSPVITTNGLGSRGLDNGVRPSGHDVSAYNDTGEALAEV